MATERALICGGLTPGRLPVDDPDPIRLDRFGPDANVRLQVERVRRELVGDPPDVLADLLDLAAYVYAGEQAVTRGGLRADDLGASWRRVLFFRVPVRRPDVWRDPGTAALLADVLGFLTDDEYRFDFRPWRGPRPSFQPHLPFGTTPFTGDVEDVVMFSGGLDSLAGAAHEALVDRRRVLLLNHRSTSKLVSGVEELVAELGRRAGPHAPAFVPVWANKDKSLGREYTQRSRSFLFTALGAVMASAIGLPRLRFYENGVVGLNLPLSAQVVGARASRTTHPRVLAGFGRLLSRLLGRPFAVENPFLWDTKTDVVRRIADAGCADLIARATSCAHTWERTRDETHCGVCSQCVDRRFAVLAAGLADHDPVDRYGVDLFTGERPDEGHRLLTAGYLETARAVHGMDGPAAFVGRFAGEVARAVPFLPGPADDSARRVWELYRRHAGQVQGVVAAGIARHAGRLADRSVPDSSLLRQVLAEAPDVPSMLPTAVAADPPAGADNVFRRQGKGWVVRFGGGESIVLPDRVGLTYLRELLTAPNRPVSAVDLACRAHRLDPRQSLGGGDDRADAEAREAYRARLLELKDEIDAARRDNDPGRADQLRGEFDRLAELVRKDQGVGGRSRRDGDDREKVRKKVGNAVRRARDEIGKYHRGLFDHLHAHLTCGRQPLYHPPTDPGWQT